MRPLESPVEASSGTEGASFLDIPVGAEPGSLGSAYSALASNAYAPTWNPGGLGYVDSPSLAVQYLSYVESIQYEYLSYVHPFEPGKSLGFAIQYLGSGNISGTDISGNPTDTFTADYGAYALAYGQTLSDQFSLGASAKLIHAALSDVTANAYAFDLGSMYKADSHLTLAATLTNLGTPLNFLSTGDSLPLAFHAAAAYNFNPILPCILSLEGIYPQTGSASAHIGMEWEPLKEIALRVGYRSDTLPGLSPLAGLSLGMGIKVWEQEFSYAWLPLGELGNTQYFSFIFHFGSPKRRRNLIQFQALKKSPTSDEQSNIDYQDIMELLSEDEPHEAQSRSDSTTRD